MADQPEQNYANHIRLDKPYFFAVAPLLLSGVVLCLIAAVRDFGLSTLGSLLVAFATIGIWVKARSYAAQNQDRIVRLEMRLRLEKLLGDDLRARIPELSRLQLIGLRFASDEELPELTRKALDEGLTKADDIKKLVKNWQADTWRV